LPARTRIGLVCSRGIGPERGGRQVNEDNFLVCREGLACFQQDGVDRCEERDGEGLLVAVADGMGGHEHGAVASATAVQALARFYRRPVPEDPERALHQYLLDSHRKLHARAVEKGSANMGTTLTTAWLLGGAGHWAHVGDSRLYVFRGNELRLVSRDHTRKEFGRRLGINNPAHAHTLVQNFIYGSRGLGTNAEIRLDLGTDTGTIPLQADDRLLLCTDGITGFLSDHGVFEGLRAVADPAATATWLAEQAMAAGSDDNLTAIVICVDAV